MTQYLVVNFGGPRTLDEIEPFLKELLTDPDVIRTRMPYFLQKFLFSRVAKKRALKIAKDYEEIGGKSPIYFDTEEIAQKLRKKLNAQVHTFHRCLPMTHPAFIETMNQIDDEIVVFPLFPQFCYATTGSVARFFSENLKNKNQLRWVKSYPAHKAFIQSYQKRIARFLMEQNLHEKGTLLLFSAHGVPEVFVNEGDVYQKECIDSVKEVMKHFSSPWQLSYQSKFGKGEWLKPYTEDVAKNIKKWSQGKENIVFVPISFTSDHIETLYEIETYVQMARKEGVNAWRCPALNTEDYWVDGIVEILGEKNFCGNEMLIRRTKSKLI